jgi:hypothetical protein
VVEVITRAGVRPTLRARGPAFSIIRKCLEVQAGATPRGAVARFLGRSPLHPDARTWYEGALGEGEVARALASLGEEWCVLNSVPIGASDPEIAHLLVGPPGIFALSIQHHDGRKAFAGGRSLRIDGQSTDYVRVSVYEGARAAKALASASGGIVHVHSAIILVGVSSLVRGAKESPVEVLLCTELLGWLQGMPRRLAPDTISYFGMVAEEPSTWHLPIVTLTRTLQYVERFGELERDVTEARRRARLVRIVAIAVGIAVVAAMVLTGLHR